MKMVYKILIYLFIVLFVGCSDNNDYNNDQLVKWNSHMQQYVMPNILNANRKYDYYEIANGQIVYTNINMDYINVINYINYNTNPQYNSSIYDINNTYHIVNEALNIDRVEDCMIFYTYDTSTKINQKSVYIKDFGLYEASQNFCTVNSNESNCTSYLYIRY